jgi:hypothetical protein
MSSFTRDVQAVVAWCQMWLSNPPRAKWSRNTRGPKSWSRHWQVNRGWCLDVRQATLTAWASRIHDVSHRHHHGESRSRDPRTQPIHPCRAVRSGAEAEPVASIVPPAIRAPRESHLAGLRSGLRLGRWCCRVRCWHESAGVLGPSTALAPASTVRPPACRLIPPQAQPVADLQQRHGNFLVHSPGISRRNCPGYTRGLRRRHSHPVARPLWRPRGPRRRAGRTPAQRFGL